MIYIKSHYSRLSSGYYWLSLSNTSSLVYFIGCHVTSYLGYSANEGTGLLLYNRRVILLLPVEYLGIDVCPVYSLAPYSLNNFSFWY